MSYDKDKTDVTSKVGVRYIVDVEYSGIPIPVITWKKDGEIMEDTSVIETRDSMSRIAIQKLAMCHSGQYTITAENSVGRGTATFVLDVKGELGQNINMVW